MHMDRRVEKGWAPHHLTAEPDNAQKQQAFLKLPPHFSTYEATIMILRRIHLARERDHRSDESKRRLNTSDEYEHLFSHRHHCDHTRPLSHLIYHRIEDLSLATTAIRAGSFPFTPLIPFTSDLQVTKHPHRGPDSAVARKRPND